MDLNMLAIHGCSGWRVRTADEFQILLKQSGFKLGRIIRTGSSVSVVEALPT